MQTAGMAREVARLPVLPSRENGVKKWRRPTEQDREAEEVTPTEKKKEYRVETERERDIGSLSWSLRRARQSWRNLLFRFLLGPLHHGEMFPRRITRVLTSGKIGF